MKQLVLTPAAGKRLIGKALALHPEIWKVLKKGTLVIIAGTTNGYVAEEILATIGASNDFTRERFFRGIILPPRHQTTETGRIADEKRRLNEAAPPWVEWCEITPFGAASLAVGEIGVYE